MTAQNGILEGGKCLKTNQSDFYTLYHNLLTVKQHGSASMAEILSCVL
jgi:hypothetical protein